MALSGYQQQTQNLLDDFGAVEYTLANLTVYINAARALIAATSESLRGEPTMLLSAAQASYKYFGLATGFESGIAALLTVRMVRLKTATGFVQIEMRPWEWFESFYLSAPVTATGAPAVCSVLRPGVNGTLYFAPVPDAIYTVQINGVCGPEDLVDDNTVEALTFPWFDPVQYYAAYLALLNTQRNSDAAIMYQRYQEALRIASQTATTTRLPGIAPGGMGSHIAGTHSPITAPMPQPAQGRGG